MPTTSKAPSSRKPKAQKPAEVNVADDADLEIPELGPDFFKNAAVGKYYEEYRRTHMVCLEPDVARHFPNERAVNEALRVLIQLRNVVSPPKQVAEADAPAKQSA